MKDFLQTWYEFWRGASIMILYILGVAVVGLAPSAILTLALSCNGWYALLLIPWSLLIPAIIHFC